MAMAKTGNAGLSLNSAPAGAENAKRHIANCTCLPHKVSGTYDDGIKL